MSENYFGEEVFFESDPDQNFDCESRTAKNEADMGQANKSTNPVSVHTAGQKNKYINRIRSMAPIESLINSQRNVEDDGKSLDKKERNKMAAKNSRDRKKLYIEIMEDKRRALEKQLQSKKRELEESKNYYDRIVSQSKTMSNFAASRHQLIKRLETLLEGSQADPTPEINDIIDNLRSRIGATGKQRINTINEYFRQIVNLSLPALHRYMMWSAAERKHLFAVDEEHEADHEEWFRELKNSLNLTEEQKREIQNKQNFLSEQKKTLEGLIEELRGVKDEIESKSIELDDIIDGIRKILTPVQCAHFILFIEKNKYRKQLNLCDPANSEEGLPRKLVKRQ